MVTLDDGDNEITLAITPSTMDYVRRPTTLPDDDEKYVPYGFDVLR